MCRFVAYHGKPILMEELISLPEHSLIRQSLHATEGPSETNGDGFGLGWYGEREKPGLYREITPAWSDENLLSICAQVRARMFFAHVRAATGTATSRANCHPFAVGRYLFMHNGQIGGYHTIRRRLEALIPDALYNDRIGTTDTEALFLIGLANGLEQDPVQAMARTIRLVLVEMDRASIRAPVHVTAALTDGQKIWAFRWASDMTPATLYHRRSETNTIVVSEPVDEKRDDWLEVPPNHVLVARHGDPGTLIPFNPARSA